MQLLQSILFFFSLSLGLTACSGIEVKFTEDSIFYSEPEKEENSVEKKETEVAQETTTQIEPVQEEDKGEVTVEYDAAAGYE